MRRVLVALSLLGLVYATSPALGVAQTEGRAVCEGYCAGVVAAGCFVFLQWFVGKDKCEAMYEGCLNGCIQALEEEEV